MSSHIIFQPRMKNPCFLYINPYIYSIEWFGNNWVNCYHSYPAHAAFGGYKNSGIGRETHKMMLNHYQQTKNVLVSYAESPDGFF